MSLRIPHDQGGRIIKAATCHNIRLPPQCMIGAVIQMDLPSDKKFQSTQMFPRSTILYRSHQELLDDTHFIKNGTSDVKNIAF